MEDLKRIELPLFPLEKRPESTLLVGKGSRSGIIMTARGPMLVASRPITTTDAKSPVQGTLTMGRFLSRDMIDSLFGYPADEFGLDRLVEMMRIDTVIDPETGYENPDDYLAALSQGAIRQCRVDFRVDTAAGSKWISHVAVPVRDGKTNKITGALGIFQDITARKQAEEKVQMPPDLLRHPHPARESGYPACHSFPENLKCCGSFIPKRK